MSDGYRTLTGNLLLPGMHHRELRPLGYSMTSRDRSTFIAGPEKALFGSPAGRLILHLQTNIKLSVPIPFDHTCGLKADVTVLQMIKNHHPLAFAARQDYGPEPPVFRCAHLPLPLPVAGMVA